jgi:hypothetical protein
MRLPFERLSSSGQLILFAVSFVLTVVLSVVLYLLGRPLQHKASPHGIISLELAGKPARIQTILEAWGQEGRALARKHIGLDYLYLVCYSTAIVLGCALVARHLSSQFSVLATVGGILAWAQFAAALLDAVENYAMLRILNRPQGAFWPAVALGCALPKFVIILLGLLYVGLGFLWWILGPKR